MPNRGTHRRGAPGICGSTVATVNAVCVLGACFQNRSPTFEKLNAIFFAAITWRCKDSGERIHGIPRNGRFPLAIDLRTFVPASSRRGYRHTNRRTLVPFEMGLHGHGMTVRSNNISCQKSHSFGKQSAPSMGRTRSVRKRSQVPAKSKCNYRLAWCGNAGNGS